MSITRMHSTQRMSKINIHNGTIYLAGQVANNVEVGIQEQTQQCLDKIDALLAEVNSDKNHVLSATIFIRDIANDFAPMNEIWDAWVADGEKPGRACVEANMAREALLVEICVIAAVKD